MWIPRYRSPVGVLHAAMAAMGVGEDNASAVLGQPEGAFAIMASASDALNRWLASQPSKGVVILPAYTCIRVVQAVKQTGWSCSFVDVDKATLEFDQEQLANALAARSGQLTVVLATHLHGMPLQLADLRQLTTAVGALLVEDCAMALGAASVEGAVGSTGDAAIYSFGLGKALSLGFGGALVAPNCETLPAADSMQTHASVLAATLSRAGWLGEMRIRLQDRLRVLFRKARGAADAKFRPVSMRPVSVLLLKRLLSGADVARDLHDKRARSAEWLDWIGRQGFTRVGTFRAASGAKPCCPGIPLLVEGRAVLGRALAEVGVDVSTYFSYCAADLSGHSGDFQGARWIAQRVLLLPNDARLDAKADRIKRVLIDHARRS